MWNSTHLASRSGLFHSQLSDLLSTFIKERRDFSAALVPVCRHCLQWLCWWPQVVLTVAVLISCWWGRKSVYSLQVCPVQSSGSSILTEDLAGHKRLILPLWDWAAFSYSRLLWLLFDLSNEVLVVKFGKYKICTLNTTLTFFPQMTNILNA